jgi:hypothetical protein
LLQQEGAPVAAEVVGCGVCMLYSGDIMSCVFVCIYTWTGAHTLFRIITLTFEGTVCGLGLAFFPTLVRLDLEDSLALLVHMINT